MDLDAGSGSKYDFTKSFYQDNMQPQWMGAAAIAVGLSLYTRSFLQIAVALVLHVAVTWYFAGARGMSLIYNFLAGTQGAQGYRIIPGLVIASDAYDAYDNAPQKTNIAHALAFASGYITQAFFLKGRRALF